MQNYLSIKEATKFVGAKSYNTFKNNFINQGLPMVVVGKSKRIDIRDLERFISEHKESK